ncbi:helix-turn-helix domain-containing protein [Micromonospora sp. AMSO12t]|uniref:helix-turn-helix domain-containing protein n=1 Tax=unclassified Micromonospora TaxID=2617518 RepID=UPI00124B5250|nr:helix-turn-helix domain-containing protein [Micromonospora sp. AMSO12t]KAB1161408.1 helix-turn-helix domain-containing protein [Micromonospora sp. AMSO12t]
MKERHPQNESEKAVAKWTVERVQSLGAVTNVVTAGAVLGIGRTKAYELAKVNQFPVRILKVGRRYLVPVADIMDLLVGGTASNHSSIRENGASP